MLQLFKNKRKSFTITYDILITRIGTEVNFRISNKKGYNLCSTNNQR